MAKKKTAKKPATKKKAAINKKTATKPAQHKMVAKKKKAEKSGFNALREARLAQEKRQPPKRPKREIAPDLRSMRGVVTFDTNEIIILARGTCEKVAEAFKKQKKLNTWVKNAVGKSVTIEGPSYLVYQLKTHPWVIIDGLWGVYPRPEDAEELSKRLDTRTIFYGNSDTSGVTRYDVYDSGKQVEHFDVGDDGVKFRSEIRKVNAPDDGPDVESFVFDFIEGQDAFAPGWSLYDFNASRHKKGDRVSLAFEEVLHDALDRFDFVGA